MDVKIAVQGFVDWHHRKCVQALQTIAMLADTGSKEHKERFDPDGPNGIPAGWQVAEAMREIANDVVGGVLLQNPLIKPRGFWCEFDDKGRCLDLVEGTPDNPVGDQYVWIQEVL